MSKTAARKGLGMHRLRTTLLRRSTLMLGGLGAVLLLLACDLNLPGPPASTGGSPLLSPAPTLSPLGGLSPLATAPQGDDSALSISPTQLTPILLAGTGGFLFIVTGIGVYLLIQGRQRKRSRRQATHSRPSRTPRAVDGHTLPEGTVLDEGRFVVLRVRSTSADGTLYEVKATTPLVLCERCYAPSEGTTKQFCNRCGARLPETTPSAATLLAREALDPQVFASAAELLSEQIAHRAVIIPIAVFAETSFGQPRYFQVEPIIHHPLASGVERPQPLGKVLDWGISLAHGLAHLHDHDVILDRITLDDAILDGDEARWLCLDGVSLVAAGGNGGRVTRVAANVRELARMLLLLATGSEVKDAASRAQTAGALPESLSRVLSQVLKSQGLLRASDFAVALEQAREQQVQHEPVRFLVGQRTDVGHVRKLNEDSILVADLTAEKVAKRETRKLSVGAFVVADGVGGHAAGDVASQTAVAAIAKYTDDLRRSVSLGEPLDAEAWLARAAKAANQAVFSARQAASNDMGSTLVMALVMGRAATVLNVGDSRGYWLRPQSIQQITTDHSLVQRLIDIGQLTPEEARHHPQRSVIYRVIGDTPDLAMDLFDVVLAPGEAILLCSDGLSDMVTDNVLWQVWREAASPQAACDQMVSLAKEAGGYDNISVIIAQIAQ
jgi:PPM family protein phosphatase